MLLRRLLILDCCVQDTKGTINNKAIDHYSCDSSFINASTEPDGLSQNLPMLTIGSVEIVEILN